MADRHAVPELIHRLKDDWDSVAIETHALKQHIFKLRKELSHVLYQQDASCRVIARLLKERDDARRLLGELETERVKHTSSEAVKQKVASNGYLSKTLLDRLQTKHVELMTDRKQKKKLKNAFVEYAGEEVV